MLHRARAALQGHSLLPAVPGRSGPLDSGNERILWTYSFKLKDDVFPGEFGAVGRWLFRVGFLDRDYAAMMRGVLSGYKTTSEAKS